MFAAGAFSTTGDPLRVEWYGKSKDGTLRWHEVFVKRVTIGGQDRILALARDILEMHGYRVLAARNGEEALGVFRDHAKTIDLVLLDLTMPVMGGRECFRRLKEMDAGVRVLISSGFSAEGTAAELLGEGALAYVQKPYDVDALARVVRQALEQGPRLVASRN